MPEWSIGAVSKTVERFAFQGFESLSLRNRIGIAKWLSQSYTDFYFARLPNNPPFSWSIWIESVLFSFFFGIHVLLHGKDLEHFENTTKILQKTQPFSTFFPKTADFFSKQHGPWTHFVHFHHMLLNPKTVLFHFNFCSRFHGIIRSDMAFLYFCGNYWGISKCSKLILLLLSCKLSAVSYQLGSTIADCWWLTADGKNLLPFM